MNLRTVVEIAKGRGYTVEETYVLLEGHGISIPFEELSELWRRHTIVEHYIDEGIGKVFRQEVEWRERALCRGQDPQIWEDEREPDVAKLICSSCPVKQECLRYAMKAEEPQGVWGGLTTSERRKLARRRSA